MVQWDNTRFPATQCTLEEFGRLTALDEEAADAHARAVEQLAVAKTQQVHRATLLHSEQRHLIDAVAASSRTHEVARPVSSPLGRATDSVNRGGFVSAPAPGAADGSDLEHEHENQRHTSIVPEHSIASTMGELSVSPPLMTPLAALADSPAAAVSRVSAARTSTSTCRSSAASRVSGVGSDKGERRSGGKGVVAASDAQKQRVVLGIHATEVRRHRLQGAAVGLAFGLGIGAIVVGLLLAHASAPVADASACS